MTVFSMNNGNSKKLVVIVLLGMVSVLTMTSIVSRQNRLARDLAIAEATLAAKAAAEAAKEPSSWMAHHMMPVITCQASDDECHIYREDIKLAAITSYFNSQDPERQSELDIALASLIGSPVIDEVHTMVEDRDLPLPSFATNSPKHHQSRITERPQMGEFIRYACKHLKGYRVLFTNADITVDLSLEYFKKISDNKFKKKFYATSRYWLSKEGKGLTFEPYVVVGSYDTFVFHADVICEDPAVSDDLANNLDYHLGRLGQENRLLWEVSQRFPHLELLNPVISVKTYHLHSSEERPASWVDRVDDGRSVVIDGAI
ncbi:hypothetical protein BGZ49_005533 [Haplosporangium sp. Z 27]|nr:hypothetical protein BGZ49_005533 [Haplosporangium sp. Z 27]